jgi:hypothetical protein
MLSLAARIEESRASLDLLERSLSAQVRFNTAITCEETRAVEKQLSAQQALDSTKSRVKTVDGIISAEQQQLRRLSSDAAARRANLARVEALVRDRDTDVLRQKQDASVARQVLLAEVEHAREQTAWLDELLVENKRLRLLATRLGALPGGAGGFTAEADGGEDEESVSSSNGDQPAVTTIHGSEKKKKKAKERSAVALYQQHNLALLQQLVNSVELLEVEVSAPKS